jgi:hypothetical protein
MGCADSAVSGIRLRRENGSNLAVAGSREGPFLPMTGWPGDRGRLLVSEGPSDTAALFDMGFLNVVGRPSCVGPPE